MKRMPGALFWICAVCGRYRGYHRQNTHQCPSNIVKGEWLDTTFKRRLTLRKRQTQAANSAKPKPRKRSKVA